MWQFLCGRKHEIEDARLVSLKSMFDIDNSVGKLLDMPRGCCAERESIRINPADLSDTICAFANADGGTILLKKKCSNILRENMVLNLIIHGANTRVMQYFDMKIIRNGLLWL